MEKTTDFVTLMGLRGLKLQGRSPLVRLFLIDDLPDEAPHLARDFLTADEKKRADRFIRDEKRREFTVARAALRCFLGELHSLPPQDLVFRTGPHGKPQLEGSLSGIRFNLSHSHGAVAIVAAREVETGIDIERISATVKVMDLAKRFFSEREWRELEGLSGEEQRTAFFSCWTRKEAVIKALGGGLTIPLHSFDVSLDADEAELLAVRWDEQHYIELRNFPAPAGYRAALAVVSPRKDQFSTP